MGLDDCEVRVEAEVVESPELLLMGLNDRGDRPGVDGIEGVLGVESLTFLPMILNDRPGVNGVVGVKTSSIESDELNGTPFLSLISTS